MEFSIQSMDATNCTVSYQCPCGCTPSAKVSAGGKAGSEHCCCGRVHFAGTDAEEELRAYLNRRRIEGMDADIDYRFERYEVSAPWGALVPVAVALPRATGS